MGDNPFYDSFKILSKFCVVFTACYLTLLMGKHMVESGLLKYPEVVVSEYTVDATVVDSYFRDSYTQWIYTGKTVVPIHHSATYKIVVMYEDKTYEFYGKETYYKYKDSIGENVPVLLEVKTYEDGDFSMKVKEIL